MKKLLFSLAILAIVWNLSYAETLKECKTQDDKISGCIEKEYYENGNVKYETPFKNNQLDGIRKGYYENGSLMFEAPLKNGKVEGIAKTYYQNGNLASEIPYKNDKREGISKTYYSNGDFAFSTTYQDDIIINGKCANGKALTNADIDMLLDKEVLAEDDYKAMCKK